MNTITIRLADFEKALSRNLLLIAALAGVCFLLPPASWAQQSETVAACDESGIPPIPEPVPMIYGDSTEGCLVDPATESDLFRFEGNAGDVVRVNLLGQSNLFDPSVVVRDNTNAIIASQFCGTATSLPCSVSLDVTLSNDGTHTLSVSDAGTDSIGIYTMQLERIFPAPSIERLNYDSRVVVDGRVTTFVDESSVADSILPATDVDHYYFNGVAGTTIRLNVLGQSNLFDPAIEVRDPDGNLVLNGLAEGAGCGTNTSLPCSFAADLDLTATGTYSVLHYDIANDSTGNFQISLWCVVGQCDNDGDTVVDIRREMLRYGESVTIKSIVPEVDGDHFAFMGTPGDDIQFSVSGQSNLFDPTIEVRDPNGDVLLDGAADGAGCGTNTSLPCSFTVPVSPPISGTHTLVLYDDGTNSIGNYDLTLECNFSPGDFVCENLPGRFPNDVPEDYWAFTFIETLADYGITSGCSVDRYCPQDPVTRGQMSVFMLRGINDGNYVPPECQGDVFADVGEGNTFCSFIEQFFEEGITSGCGPGLYCPEDPVTRAQMAVFLLRAKYGANHVPPAPTGIVFEDVDAGHWAAAWIEELAAEGITAGCSAEPALYCPEEPVTRDQMAVFVVRTFDL